MHKYVQCFNCAKYLLIRFPFQFINYGLSTKYCYLPSIPIKSHPLVLKLFHGGNSLHFSCPLLFSEVIDCLITLPTWVPSFPYHYSGVWVTWFCYLWSWILTLKCNFLDVFIIWFSFQAEAKIQRIYFFLLSSLWYHYFWDFSLKCEQVFQ